MSRFYGSVCSLLFLVGHAVNEIDEIWSRYLADELSERDKIQQVDRGGLTVRQNQN